MKTVGLKKISIFAMLPVVALFSSDMLSLHAADSAVFFWKGPTWGKFNNPDNWDVGAQGNGNPDNRIPGEDDTFDFASNAYIDLDGKTFTVKRRSKDLTSGADGGVTASYTYLNLTNGTLVVRDLHSKRLNFDVYNGATYRFCGFYRDAIGLPDESRQTIHSGGRFEFVNSASVEMYGTYITVKEGGYLYFDPHRFYTYPTTQRTAQFTNNGTFEAPNGMYLTRCDWNSASLPLPAEQEWFPRFYQNGGVFKLGGNFGRENHTSAKQIGLTLSGGTVEITNTVSFVNMSANPPVVSDNASLVFDVKKDSVFNIAGLEIGEGVTIAKTGSGDLIFDEIVPSSLEVEAGRIIFSKAITAPRMSFAEGSEILVEEEMTRIDECEGFTNTVFSVAEELLRVDSVVLCSEDEVILDHAKKCIDAQLLAAGVEAEGRVIDGILAIRPIYSYTFDAGKSADLSDPSAWSSQAVPSVDVPVCIRGTGVVNYNSESVKFASIALEEGATLSVAGGTAEAPFDLPPIELNYNTKLLLTGGSVVQITNEFTCVGNAMILPVFEIATNATAIVQTPNIGVIPSAIDKYQTGTDFGFRLKNVALRWYGDIQTYCSDVGKGKLYDSGWRDQYHCRLVLGWAEAGETSYISVDCRGGRYIAACEPHHSLKCRTPLAMVIPNAGGTVVPVGTLYFRDYSCVQRLVSTYSNPDCYVPGMFIGRWREWDDGNPASVKFDVVFEGATDINLNGVFRVGGGARVVLRGPEVQWKYARKAWNDEDFPRTVVFHDSGSLELEDGAYLASTTSDDDTYRGVVAKVDEEGYKVLTVNNSRLELLNWSGNGRNVAEVNDSVLEIGYLRSANTLGNITGVFDGLKSVSIMNDFTILAADVGRGNENKTTSVIPVENWDRRVFIAPPLTGTGSLVVSNRLSGAHAVYSMTVTVTNGSNTATGNAFAAETATGAPAVLVFADGANWAGEVIANDKVSLTNLVEEGGAAEVSFASLRAESAFPLRVWKTDGTITANDKVNLGSVIKGDNSFSLVEMGERLELGDSIEIGLYPAGAELPERTRFMHYFTTPSDVDGYDILNARRSSRGTVVFIR